MKAAGVSSGSSSEIPDREGSELDSNPPQHSRSLLSFEIT
jgi:hypothetical protein